MKKSIITILSGILFNLSVAQPTDLSRTVEAFDNLIAEKYKSNEPGITVLVAKKGEIIYKKAVGMANLETGTPMREDYVFRIASITKQFTAVAILQLMEQGKLSLQDEITKYIPDYPVHGHKITIENLLTHTSGIFNYTNMQDYEERMTLDLKPVEMINHFKNMPMNFAPGTRWDYSNSGYFLLGYIIEKITGKSYGEYLEENFFKPLGMNNSFYGSNSKIIKNRAAGYSRNENEFENAMPISMTQPFAAGSIQSTVEDLFKWNQAVVNFKLIKKENVLKAFSRYQLADGTKTDYGYGWSFGLIHASETIEHSGGINGFATEGIYLPKEDIYVVVFSNCDCNPPSFIAAKMAAIAIGKPYEFKEISLENSILERYSGVYENEKGELRSISFSQNELFSQRGRGRKFKIKAYEKDKFFFEDAFVTIEFNRNKKGEIENLTTYSRYGIEVWKKTNKPAPSDPVIVKVDKIILDAYVGEYEIKPGFTLLITREEDRLFAQPTGQEKLEIFAESENKFFLKENGVQLEFINESGKVTKLILIQNGRKTEAGKIR